MYTLYTLMPTWCHLVSLFWHSFLVNDASYLMQEKSRRWTSKMYLGLCKQLFFKQNMFIIGVHHFFFFFPMWPNVLIHAGRHRPLPSNTLPRRLKLSSYPQSFTQYSECAVLRWYVMSKKGNIPTFTVRHPTWNADVFLNFCTRMLSRARFCWAPHPIDSTSRWDPNQSAMGWFVVWGNKPSWSNSFKHMDVLVWIAHNGNLVRTSWPWAGQKDDV